MYEEWVTLSDLGNYAVNQKGQVMNTRTKKLLKGSVTEKGYLRVGLRVMGKLRLVYVHRLVAFVFHPDYDRDRSVTHINANKLDNHVLNLRIGALCRGDGDAVV